MQGALKIVSLTKRFGGNFLVNTLQQGVRFMILYVAAKQLGPKEFGTLSLVLLAASYLLNANLGTINGLKRQIPLVYLQKGGKYSLQAFSNILNFNWLTTFTISSITSYILRVYYHLDILSCMLLIMLSVTNNTYFSIQTYFTSSGNWKNLFKLQLFCGLLLIVTLISVFFSNSYLLLICYSLSFVFAGVFFFIENRHHFSLNKEIITENLKVGFPIMISGFIYLIFQTTDRVIVSRFYTKEEFGYYSFGWIVVMSLNLLVNFSSEIILQRSTARYSLTEDKKDLFRYILKNSFLMQTALTLLSLLLVAVFYIAVPMCMPEYFDALPIIYNIVIAYLIQQFGLPAANYYCIVRRQSIYNIILLLSCVINACILLYPFLFLSTQKPSLTQLSRLCILGSCIYVILLYAPFIVKKKRDGRF